MVNKFRLSKWLYTKIIRSFNLTRQLEGLNQEIENALIVRGIDMAKLREDDGHLVEMANYGHAFFSREELEKDFKKYKKEEARNGK